MASCETGGVSPTVKRILCRCWPWAPHWQRVVCRDCPRYVSETCHIIAAKRGALAYALSSGREGGLSEADTRSADSLGFPHPTPDLLFFHVGTCLDAARSVKDAARTTAVLQGLLPTGQGGTRLSSLSDTASGTAQTTGSSPTDKIVPDVGRVCHEGIAKVHGPVSSLRSPRLHDKYILFSRTRGPFCRRPEQ